MTLRRSFVVPSSAIFCVFVITILGNADARAVNISNTWILPEEGFPVFYRYFRDRISWYEADAVCQFHHANLITVDSTAQYDAARAYLKELDIMSNVWIGLIKSNEEGGFSWTDYKPLSGEGYWASAPEEGRTPLCTALDPAKDYRWSALGCGGPQVASFICELQVPTWALKPEGGCLVKSLPSLTVQFLPELAAVQLISDCGLDGTKKVTCKSNESHPDVLKELSCALSEDDFSDNQVTAMGSSSSGSTNPFHSDTPSFTTASPGDYSTRLRRETIPTSPPVSLSTLQTTSTSTPKVQQKPLQTIPVQVAQNTINATPKSQDIQPTTIEKQPETQMKTSTPHSEITDESLVSENPTKPTITTTFATIITAATSAEKPDVARVAVATEKKIVLSVAKEQKLKGKEPHDNVYTAPTDHFIPPLVMAKSKVSTDMTVVSLEEKHLQQKNNHNSNKQMNHEQLTTTKQDSLITTEISHLSTESQSTTVSPSVIPSTTQKPATPKSKPKVVIPAVTTSKTKLITEKSQETTIVSVTEKYEENMIDSSDAKIRKPSKGKKYDKYKEEKKKYKDMQVLNKQDESANKVIAVTIPNTDVKTTPLAIIEITTKLTEAPSTPKDIHPTTEKIAPPTVTVTQPSPIDTQITTTEITFKNNSKDQNKTILIDPNILELNKAGNSNINNESEAVHHGANFTSESQEDSKNKTDPINKNEKITVNVNNKTVSKVNTSELDNPERVEETLEQTPDPLPKPNRSRILTQTPQHRSFYPYLFNRVLG